MQKIEEIATSIDKEAMLNPAKGRLPRMPSSTSASLKKSRRSTTPTNTNPLYVSVNLDNDLAVGEIMFAEDFERPVLKDLTPAMVDKVKTFIKVCAIFEVLAFNDLNQMLICMVKAPQSLMFNMNRILKSLKNYKGYSDNFQKEVIKSALKCLSVSLRQHSTITSFLQNKNDLLL